MTVGAPPLSGLSGSAQHGIKVIHPIVQDKNIWSSLQLIFCDDNVEFLVQHIKIPRGKPRISKKQGDLTSSTSCWTSTITKLSIWGSTFSSPLRSVFRRGCMLPVKCKNVFAESSKRKDLTDLLSRGADSSVRVNTFRLT